MVQRLKIYFLKRYLPRWFVLFFDLSIVLLTFLVAFILRFNFNLVEAESSLDVLQILVIIPIFLFSFILAKSFCGVLRHSTIEDITRMVYALGISSIILIVFSFIMRQCSICQKMIIPYSVIIIQFAIASNILLTSRLLAKAIYNEWFITRKKVKKVMIYGAGRLGQLTRNALMMIDTEQIKLVGYIENNAFLYHKRSGGVPIYSVKETFDKIIKENKVSEIILAIDHSSSVLKQKREIVDLCLPRKIDVKEVPAIDKWINGELNPKEIKKIKIEDLLGRETINLENTKIKEGVKNAVVLVAGAAGSIGSEIVNQLIKYNAHQVILLDKAESDLYDLQNEILAKNNAPKFNVIVGDVTNLTRLKNIFDTYHPNIVINAAAYKHVPLMEEFPCEAIHTNLGGTKNLANLSVEFGVKKFVLISTDKAVNPTNVMGATKRLCEIYVQSLAQKESIKTQFITTRFGNVLGSNGSVVPLFRKQIEKGGPVTVTHRDITRFFMTIPEACQLVLEACFMGKGGEIFVFDMGEPVRIYDLAEKMIYLSGFIPNKDIKIKITNLRPGEKLYEELLKTQENLLPTYNEKIMIGKFMKHDYEIVNKQVSYLLDAIELLNNQELVSFIKTIVPEYISMNSPYSSSNITLKDKEVKKAIIPANGKQFIELVS